MSRPLLLQSRPQSARAAASRRDPQQADDRKAATGRRRGAAEDGRRLEAATAGADGRHRAGPRQAAGGGCCYDGQLLPLPRQRLDGRAAATGGRRRRGQRGRHNWRQRQEAATGGAQRMTATDLPAPHARRRAGAAVDPRRADLHRHRPHGWTERRRAGTDGTPGGDERMRARTAGSAAMGKKIGTLLCSAASTQPTTGKMGLGHGFAAPGSKDGSSRGQRSGMTKGGGPDLEPTMLQMDACCVDRGPKGNIYRVHETPQTLEYVK